MTGPLATPGPWEWDAGLVPPDGPERYAEIYIVRGGGEPLVIAEFNNCIPEGKANARLIAAAPEVTDALANLLAATERHVFGDECQTERRQARNALAKATGGSND